MYKCVKVINGGGIHFGGMALLIVDSIGTPVAYSRSSSRLHSGPWLL